MLSIGGTLSGERGGDIEQSEAPARSDGILNEGLWH